MPDIQSPKPLIGLEITSGNVLLRFDCQTLGKVALSTATPGGGQQEIFISRRQAIWAHVALGKLLETLKSEGALSRDHVALMSQARASWRRYAVRPASDQTGGRANA